MLRHDVLSSIFLGSLLAFPMPLQSDESVQDVGWFLQRMRSVEYLPELEDSHTAMASTWDHSGGNNDAADFKDLRDSPPKGDSPIFPAEKLGQSPTARNVLLDVDGTGSEEYFNSGWCRFDRKVVSGFLTLRPGHPTVYSFHLNDAFQFQRRICVVEE
ncbi:MAG: DUF2961 domain-containing protein [Pirellulales bacterium]|nr:DUF2961 domain-containing protein [Pirellulales bacterium]